MGPESSSRSSLFAHAARVVVLILILTVLTLGYLAYQRMRDGSSARDGAPSGTETGTDLPPLSEDEQAALRGPAFTGSVEDFNKSLAAIDRAAVAAGALVVGEGCAVRPVVLKVAAGATFDITNTDRIPHTLTMDTFSGARSFTAPAQGSISVTVDFGSPGSTYGISCDSRSAPAGLLVVGG